MANKEAELQEIKHLLGEVANRMAHLTSDVREDLMAQSGETVEALKERFVSHVEQAKVKAGEMGAKAKELKDQSNAYAHEHPWHIALGAAALGVVLGVLVASRRE